MFLLYFVTVCYCEAVRLSTSSGRDRSEVVMSSYYMCFESLALYGNRCNHIYSSVRFNISLY